MSERVYYVASQNKEKLYDEKTVEFWYFRGFSAVQKRRSITSMHEQICKLNKGARPLEISEYSLERVGVKLCDQNLKLNIKKLRRYISVRALFDASKVFEKGGPYVDLLKKSADEAALDKRLKNSGQVVGYLFEGERWPTTPTNMFYDYLYIRALYENEQCFEEVMNFDVFTDIDVGQEKAINCPARAVAIAASLHKRGELESSLQSKEAFEKAYKLTGQTEQISLF